MSLPGQRLLIHSTSFQFSVGSNWLGGPLRQRVDVLHAADVAGEIAEGLALAAQRSLSAQAGLVAMSMRLLSLISGGTVRPFVMSRWRWPSTCRSTVSTSALHLAAAARSISARMKPRSLMT